MRVLLASILFIPYFISLSQNVELKPHFLEISATVSDSVQTDTLVHMERTICFGTCPSYELTILKNGSVIFIGKEFVQQEGRAEGMISDEDMEELISAIRTSHFMEITSNPECQSRMTDHPSVFLTIQLNGKENNVTHYQGCKGFDHEDDLYDLEEAIDRLAGTQKWIGDN